MAYNPGPAVRVVVADLVLATCQIASVTFLLKYNCHNRLTFALQGWVIEGEEYPGEMVSFVKSDEEHWKSVKVRRPHPALACIHYFDGSVLHCPWIITT